ncbi:hypothetical protein [Streptomyces afghaniensis]|uniref:hypothetical protein n=1 Tax=Streptomyces afghaniensis TaxID=66865 RepID=UPI0037B79896
MGIHAIRGVLASTAVALCVIAAGPAVAAQPEEDLIDDPAEGNGLPDEPTTTPKPPENWPNGEYCGPTHGVYIPESGGKKYHKGVGPTLSNYNGTSRTAKSTFTSEVTGEVGISYTAGLTVSRDTLIVKLEGKFDVNLSAKLTAKLGNTIAVDTPSKKTTNAKYGVYRLKHVGKSYTIYSNCTTSAKKKITSYSPYRVGWYLWEG